MHSRFFAADAKNRKAQLHKMVVSEVQSITFHIIQKQSDGVWLLRYEEGIRDVLTHCMNSTQCLVIGVNVVIELWDHIYRNNNYEKWQPIIQMGSIVASDYRSMYKAKDALKDRLNNPDAPPQLRREFNNFLNLPSIDDPYKEALLELMHSYLSHLDRLAHDLNTPINAKFLNPIFKTEEELSSPLISAKLYAFLAYAYAARVNYNKALRYANISYRFYEDLRDESGMAHAANARALANRMMRLPTLARKEYKLMLEHHRKSGAISKERLFYQEASIHFEFDRFERAIERYQKCLDLLDALPIHEPHHQLLYAKCVHGIALSQVWLDQFEPALKNLNNADAIAIDLGDKYLIANNTYTRGFLEGRRKNVPKAETYLEKALEMTEEIVEETLRTDLQKSILDTMEKLALTGGGSNLHNTIYR